MRRSLVAGIPTAVFGILLILVPARVFPVCPVAEGMHPMRCHWTAAALAGFGGLFLAAGVFLFLCKGNGVRVGLSVMAVCSAILGGVIATSLIGMCMNPLMPCRTGTYPAVMILLALTALAGLINILVFGPFAKKGPESRDVPRTPPAVSRRS